MNPERERILEEIARDLGEHGERAVSFLRAADYLVENLSGSTPKGAEIVSYTLREALVSLTTSPDSSKRATNVKARELLEIFERAETSGPIDEVTSVELRNAADILRSELDRPSYATLLLNLFEKRTGAKPPPTGMDPGKRYSDLLGTANGWLHSTAGDVSSLHDDVFLFLGALFTPPAEVLEYLRRYTELDSPSHDDLRQLSIVLTSAPQVNYFFRNARSSHWLDLIRGTPFARPDARTQDWPASQLVILASKSKPEEAASWLGATVNGHSDLDSLSAFHYARTASAIGPAAVSTLVSLLRRRSNDHNVISAAHWMLQRLAPEDQRCQELADLLLNDLSDAWLVGEVVRLFVAGVTVGNALDRLTLLAYKIERALRGPYSYVPHGWSFVRADELEGSTHDGTEILLTGAALVARAALRLGLAPQILSISTRFPAPLDRQLNAWVMAEAGIAGVAARTTVAQDIQQLNPTADHFGLIDAAWVEDALAAEKAWSAALGAPLSIVDARRWSSDERIGRNFVRVTMWCEALPVEVGIAWRQVIETVREKSIPGREALIPDSGPKTIFVASPISEEELANMEPMDAVKRVVAWRPQRDDWPADAGTLGQVLERVAAAQPERWVRSLAAEMRELSSPTYVGSLLRGLGASAAEIINHVDAIDAGIRELKRQVEVAAGRDPEWQWAVNDGVRLLESLARAGADLASRPQVLSFVLARARDRSDRVSVTGMSESWNQALNRGSMKALFTLIVIAAASARAGAQVPESVSDVFDEALQLTGEDALQARSMLIDGLNEILVFLPTWLEDNESRLFGADAPAELGQETTEIFLALSGPTRWALTHLRAQIYRSASQGTHRGIGWLLIGFLDGFDGYSVEAVAIGTRDLDDEKVSTVFAQLGLMLHPIADNDRIARGVALARALLRDGFPSASAAGLGRWAAIAALDDKTWLDLNLTAVRGGTDIDNLDGVAERAARIGSDDALELLTILVDRPDTWQSRTAGVTAIEALRGHSHDNCASRTKLRNALLRHGHSEADDM